MPGKFHGRRSLVGYSPWGRMGSQRVRHDWATSLFTFRPSWGALRNLQLRPMEMTSILFKKVPREGWEPLTPLHIKKLSLLKFTKLKIAKLGVRTISPNSWFTLFLVIFHIRWPKQVWKRKIYILASEKCCHLTNG